MDDTRAREEQIETRLEWLAHKRVDIKRGYRTVPWLGLGAVAAIPAGIFWGAIAASLVLFVAAMLPMITAYIIWSHEQEYEGEARELRRQLKSLHDGTWGQDANQPWRVPGKRLNW